MKTKAIYDKLIIYMLVFSLVFPFLCGFVLIPPAYASSGDTNSFFSLIKSLFSLFFLSFLSSDKGSNDGILDESYKSASQENSSYQRIQVTPEEKKWLAKAVWAEARGESTTGQVAVAAVIINRVKSSQFPNKVKDVIFEKVDGSYAFSAVLDGQIYMPDEDDLRNSYAYQAVEQALNGWDPTNGALYYYNPVTATSDWIFENTVPLKEIGNHVFARLRTQ
ncbi:Cell Wall Hydrolase [Halobacteroides halobius DSM 5150]|uniref:Cell Wall Hydrolase n=1 Tax=Halobacteroides halobius (strain ATCC 35273 / DSM 5150 / MD-1) TaxID=748449 RepID=L0KAX5_HALHC|nr:cell wall hydrolase [Halobacteroides halobius]AGB41238.1 Cell Wall Hydrolase [Halobacteroides halobius DSM 5150]